MGLRSVPVLGRAGVLVVIAGVVMTLLGAIALLLLKRSALFLFVLAIIIATVHNASLLLNTPWLQVLGPGGQARVAFAFAVHIGTTFYIWTLVQRGTLR